MDLDVRSDVLKTDDTLEDSIGEFLETILTKTNGTHLFPEKEVTAIVLPGGNTCYDIDIMFMNFFSWLYQLQQYDKTRISLFNL